jgi:hypothetical protein
MPLQLSGTLKIVTKGRPFTDKDTGEVTPAKFTNFIAVQDSEGNPQVCELKSKQDYSKLIDELVDVEVQLYPMREGSGFYASITNMVEAVIN